ncbi:MAG: MotA/TolQ/ExbB proton channel family protein [Candidatus Marinimicrobia bacterium]|nr:MotA/TolQ/ExbB proton channel family protein [Candidatus Neomarinimicrobiota bacterium]
MDLATIIGIFTGIGLLVFSIGTENMATFLHPPSVMIVVGGSFAAIFVNFSLKEVISVFKVAKNAFKAKSININLIIDKFVELSKKARKDGILAIEKEIPKLRDPFMAMGLEMTVDGIEPEIIRNVMETELTYQIERHKRGQSIFLSLGTYAPAFGMIGTLMGLIAMLKNLDSPENIGLGMSIALITTFYGAVLANLIFLPLSGKLKNRSEEEIILREMMIEGVIAIQYGEHPFNVERLLSNFIEPTKRRKTNKE